MARETKKRPKKMRDEDVEVIPLISPEALRGVAAVFLVALATFFGLAGFGIGGTVGAFLFDVLSMLLGIGYMLFPLSLLVLAGALMRSFQGRFGIVHIGSAVVFLLRALASWILLRRAEAGAASRYLTQVSGQLRAEEQLTREQLANYVLWLAR